MRNILVMLGAMIISISSSAQFNTTYSSDNYQIQGKRVTGIPGCNGGDEIIFTNSVSTPSGPISRFMLVHTDNNMGNVINQSLHSYELEKHHIINTNDGGILIAGYLNGLSNGFASLVVMKFDPCTSLDNPTWQLKIPLNIRTNPYSNIDPYVRENIGIDKIIGNDQLDDYYVAFNEGNPDNNFANEGVISVARIDDQGNLIWHKTYSDPNRSILSKGIVNDGVNDITAYEDQPFSNTNLLCIAGTRFSEQSYFGSGVFDNDIFFISIDENGSIVYPYSQTLAGIYYSPDQIWDDSRNLLTTVYEGETWTGSGSFETGLIRLDATLTTIDNSGFRDMSGYNYSVRGQGISLNSNKDYIISCWEDSRTTTRTSGFFDIPAATIPTAAWLTTTVLVARMNNWNRDQIYFGQKHFTDANDKNYMVPTVNKLSASGATTYDRPRLIQMEFMVPYDSYVCGRWDIDLDVHSRDGLVTLTYQEDDSGDPQDFSFSYQDISLDQEWCDTSDIPNNRYYRLANNVHTNSKVQVFPTVLQNNTETVKCEFYSDNEGFAEIEIFNSIGQVFYNKREKVVKGDNSIRISTEFATGLNIIKIAAKNTITTQKIVVSR